MLKRTLSIAFVAAVNIVVLAVLLAAVEIGFRVAGGERTNRGASIQWLQFAPYVMFQNPYIPSGGYRWNDAFHGKLIVGSIFNNKLGFSSREEYSFSKVRAKGPNERVVLLSGGSAAWGVGATSNDTTVAGRMQSILNTSQTRYRYTVLNLSMGGWISVQQFIALALYGRNLQPDWLVTMDGVNDVAVTCAHSQGAGHSMYYALMDAYMKAYVFGQLHPVFYRSWVENELVKHSVAYRRLTGKIPVKFDLLLDNIDPGIGRSVIRPTTWADVEQQLDLYVQTESEMVALVPGAKALLGTQPLPFDFQKTFGQIYRDHGGPDEVAAIAALNKRLDATAAAQRNKACGLAEWDTARDWFMPASAMRLETLAEQTRRAGREVQYVNTGALFPDSMEDRKAFFIDPVHLNDGGMDVVARLYAKMILASDLPGQFTSPNWTGEIARQH